MQKKIAFFKKQVDESRGNTFLDRLRERKDTPQNVEDVAKQMWDVIAAGVYENVIRSSEEHYNLLQELSANIVILEQRGAKASDILNHVRGFLVLGEFRKTLEGD